jgi:hypothetical protein
MAIWSPRSRAKRTAAITSDTPAHRAIMAGRRSYIALNTWRAGS